MVPPPAAQRSAVDHPGCRHARWHICYGQMASHAPGLTLPRRLLRGRIEAGFPYSSVARLQHALARSLPEVATLVRIPLRTLARRKRAGRLAPDESERVLRIATVLERAERLFEGDRPAALAWLGAPHRALGGETPLEVARTEVGAREVEELIGRLEHGVFS